jgi:hypothetical protein
MKLQYFAQYGTYVKNDSVDLEFYYKNGNECVVNY